MDKIQYDSIRGEQDFIYRYFVHEGGTPIGHTAFNNLLNSWLLQMGIAPVIGKAQILKFLDKKFGY